jgi:SAM-dependent methyltransferase
LLLHQRYKEIVFWGIAKATVPNYLLRRYVMSARPRNGASCHLHLGRGTKYLSGFLNIDGNLFNKIDVWLDVRNGLPFRSNSVASIYSTHMFEHFYPDELKRLLQECVRVLKSGGGIRLIVPSLESAIAAYTQKRSDWFYDSFPRHFDSLGGRFSNFVFCDGQHRTAFDFS